MFVSRVRSRGGVPPLHAAVPRGAAPRGAPPSRAPSSRGRGVQRARGAPPTAGYRPAPPIVQDTYGEYVSIFKDQVSTESVYTNILVFFSVIGLKPIQQKLISNIDYL